MSKVSMGAGKSFAHVEGQCIAETPGTSGLGWSEDVPQETRAAVSTSSICWISSMCEIQENVSHPPRPLKWCEPLISRGFEPPTTTDPGLLEAALCYLPGTRHGTAVRLTPRAARAARGAGHGPGVAAKGGKLSSLPQLAHYSPFLHHSCP